MMTHIDWNVFYNLRLNLNLCSGRLLRLASIGIIYKFVCPLMLPTLSIFHINTFKRLLISRIADIQVTSTSWNC